jgi:ATP-dependent Clp protease adaptor protein ClpS
MPQARTQKNDRTKDALSTKEPPLYHVILLNDDFTAMDFVVDILQRVFHKQPFDAEAIMLSVHETGFGVAGKFPRAIAETKVSTVAQLARAHGFPLKSVIEPVD